MLIISERKTPLTSYGILVKVKLMEKSKTQEWLIEQLKLKFPERYYDSSIMHRILTGQVNSKKTIEAINEILEIVQ